MASTLPFTWSSVTKGNKMTLAQEEQRRLEQQSPAQQQQQQHQQQQQPRAKKNDDYWVKKAVQYNHDHGPIATPRNVSARALEFIELAIVNHPEWQTNCLTIGQLKEAFTVAYLAYIEKQYGKSMYDFKQFERVYECPELDRYENIQIWVAYKERMEKEPWLNAFWIFAKNVTFEKCLWALNVQSKAFITYEVLEEDYPADNYFHDSEDEDVDEKNVNLKPRAVHGIVRVDGNSIDNKTTLTWLVNLYNYRGTPHLDKRKYNKRELSAAL